MGRAHEVRAKAMAATAAKKSKLYKTMGLFVGVSVALVMI